MSLACTDRGDGPTLVLLHGFPLDRSLWDPQIEPLARTRRVLAPDLRGFGDSPPAGDDYSMDALAVDVLAFIDEQAGPSPFALAGLSMGGYVALAIAAHAPERLTHLILVATKASADTPEAAANRHRLADEIERQGRLQPVIDAFLPRLLGATTLRESPDMPGRVRDMMNRTSLPAAAGCLRGMAARPDRTALLATLTLPVLVVAGEEDPIAPPDEGAAMARALPNGRLSVIPRSGHLVCLERPELTSHALTDFLDAPAQSP